MPSPPPRLLFRYALHTGTSLTSHESQRPLLAALEGVPAERELPHGSIVGAIEVTHALTLEQCAADKWAFGPVCNMIRSVVRLPLPLPHKGALSVWKVADETRAALRELVSAAPVKLNGLLHFPPPSAAPLKFDVRLRVQHGSYATPKPAAPPSRPSRPLAPASAPGRRRRQ
jgi:hypothetical protein